MHQILIVDEEEHLLWALEKNLLPERDDIKIITASGGEMGLDLLRNESIDVLICDIKMPGRVDGFQLILRAKEVAPAARVVIMTAFGTNRIQNLAERIGITHYIEKPFNISDLRNVVLELLDAKEGFQGVLSDLELTDIIQMLCLAKRTALLHLKHKEHRGKIVFERGDMVHAEFDEVEGDAAVYKMLALRQGDIYMQPDFQNTKHTIHVGWQDLLLEGVRRADETRAALGLDEQAGAAEEDVYGAPIASPFMGVFEDSGEISLGMPPRLVPQVDRGAGVEESAGASFFTEEELEEIESAGSDLSKTASGFDRVEDSAVRRLINEHAAQLRGLDEESEFSPAIGPGRPTDSSDFPAQSPARTFSEPASSPQPEIIARDITPSLPDQPAYAAPLALAPPAASMRTSGAWASPGAAPGALVRQDPVRQLPVASAPPQAAARHRELPDGAASPMHARDVLAEFSREVKGLSVTGLFSFDDGLALDFVSMPGARYEADVLSAFFRDVAACAEHTSASQTGEGEFIELQIQMQREIILLRRVAHTPYVHITVLGRDVRLGIALVMMRRYGARLTRCFA